METEINWINRKYVLQIANNATLTVFALTLALTLALDLALDLTLALALAI